MIIVPLAILGGSVALMLLLAKSSSNGGGETVTTTNNGQAGSCIVQVPPVSFQLLSIDFIANANFVSAARLKFTDGTALLTNPDAFNGALTAMKAGDGMLIVGNKLPDYAGVTPLPTIGGCQSQEPARITTGDGGVVPPLVATVVIKMPNGLTDMQQLMQWANKSKLQMILPVGYALPGATSYDLELASQPRSGAIPDAWPLRAVVAPLPSAVSGLGRIQPYRRRRR